MYDKQNEAMVVNVSWDKSRHLAKEFLVDWTQLVICPREYVYNISQLSDVHVAKSFESNVVKLSRRTKPGSGEHNS